MDLVIFYKTKFLSSRQPKKAISVYVGSVFVAMNAFSLCEIF